mgnify:CR=1 FL=1
MITLRDVTLRRGEKVQAEWIDFPAGEPGIVKTTVRPANPPTARLVSECRRQLPAYAPTSIPIPRAVRTRKVEVHLRGVCDACAA